MRETTTIITATCDRYHWRIKSDGAAGKTKTECAEKLEAKGWWLGRKVTLCPKCKVAEGKVSRKGKAVNDLEPLG